jgi:hypothetical protein
MLPVLGNHRLVVLSSTIETKALIASVTTAVTIISSIVFFERRKNAETEFRELVLCRVKVINFE